MKIRSINIENVRSFKEKTSFVLDGDISIIVGPNGGGKTNLLDTVISIIRAHLMPSWSLHQENQGLSMRYRFIQESNSSNLILEKNINNQEAPQIIEVAIEITPKDIENIMCIKKEVDLIEN